MDDVHKNIFKALSKFDDLYAAVTLKSKKKNLKQQLSNLRELAVYINFSRSVTIDEILFISVIDQMDYLTDQDIDRKVHRAYIFILLELLSNVEINKTENIGLLINKFIDVLNNEIKSKIGVRQQLSWRALGELSVYANSDDIKEVIYSKLFQAINLLKYPTKPKNKSAIFSTSEKDYITSVKLWSALLSGMRRVGYKKTFTLRLEPTNNLFTAIGGEHQNISRHALAIILNAIDSIEVGSSKLMELIEIIVIRWKKGKQFLNIEDVLCISYLSRIIAKIAIKIDFNIDEQKNCVIQMFELALNALLSTKSLKTFSELVSLFINEQFSFKILILLSNKQKQQRQQQNSVNKTEEKPVMWKILNGIRGQLRDVFKGQDVGVMFVLLPLLLRLCVKVGKFLIARF